MLVTPKTHGTGKVFDANGLEWHHLRWVDTQTGKAEQMILDSEGRKQLNEAKNGVMSQEVTLPAPVLFVPFPTSHA
jgi:hypothetical protein